MADEYEAAYRQVIAERRSGVVGAVAASRA
jgi:hypothetical protein